MKKILILSLGYLFVILMMSLKSEHNDCGGKIAKVEGPPPFYSAEPPANTSCSSIGCHEDAPINTGSAQLLLSLGNAENGYELGQTYTITVSLSKAGMVRSGFQIIALIDNDITISPGLMTLTNTNRTQIVDSNNVHIGSYGRKRIWVEHTLSGSNVVSAGLNSWSFQWKAPTTNVGNITFYLAGLEADNSGDENGDQTYTLNKTISYIPAAINNINTQIKSNFYPNPATNYFTFELENSIHLEKIELYKINGEKVKVFQNEEISIFESKVTCDIRNVESGVYNIRVFQKNTVSSQKLIVIN